MAHNQGGTQELAIYSDQDVVQNRIQFNTADSVSDVLNRIRAELNLGPNVHINMIHFHGLQQVAPQSQLLGDDVMSNHFPNGGHVKIQTRELSPKEVENSRKIYGNVAGERAKQVNAIAITEANEAEKRAVEAIIAENRAAADAMQQNVITNQPPSNMNFNL